MSANYIKCLLYGIENVDDGTRNVKLKIIFHIFITLSLSPLPSSRCRMPFTGLTGRD